MGVPADKFNPKETEVNRPKPVLAEKPQKEASGPVSFIDRLDNLNRLINNCLGWLAGASLMLMVFVVVINGVLRKISDPIAGTTEIVGWLAALATAFSLGFTQVQKGYVDIDALVERFPQSFQRLLRILMNCISLAFFTMVAWKMFEYAFQVAGNGNLSETMGIPYYHLIILVAVGFIGLSAALFVDLLREAFGGDSK